MPVDLVSAISGLQHAKTVAAVQLKVARKMLDVQEYRGAAALKLLEAAGRTGAQAGDALAAAATGLGGALDTFA